MRTIISYAVLFTFLGSIWLIQPQDTSHVFFSDGDLRVCVVNNVQGANPVVAPETCDAMKVQELELVDQMLWIEGQFDVSKKLFSSTKPIGFIWSANASADFYVNGQFVESNGEPGLDSSSEIPGALDTVFFVPRDRLTAGQNTIGFLVSAHHRLGWSQSVLAARFDVYRSSPHYRVDESWWSLLLFGVLLVGAVYFGTAARFARRQSLPAMLSFASTLACVQLLAESLRSLWAYPYPVHEIRMFVICVCSAGVGLTLLAHTVDRWGVPHIRTWLCVAGTIAGAGVWFSQGFDNSAGWAMIATSGASCFVSLAAALETRKPSAWVYLCFFVVFTSLVVFDPSEFLDRWYFLSLAALLLGLFVQNARSMKKLRENYQHDVDSGSEEPGALVHAAPRAGQFIEIREKSSVFRLDIDDIEWCCSAGDYVAIHLSNGGTFLHSESLVSLEKTLPCNFLRPHRSSIVNSHYVQKLDRNASGTGTLTMKSGDTVSVSRRALPRVRQSLSTENGQLSGNS